MLADEAGLRSVLLPPNLHCADLPRFVHPLLGGEWGRLSFLAVRKFF